MSENPPVNPPPFDPPPPPPPGDGGAGTPPPPGFPTAPPVDPAYGYGAPPAPVPAGFAFDPASGLALPPGVTLAPVGRRVGAFFLSLLLAIVTLGIGYIIWGLILWGKGTSPALKVLGMKAWKPTDNRVATFGTMALRNIVGGIVQVILGFITELISFIMFLTGKQHKGLPDTIGGTVIVFDPNKVLG